MRELTASSAGGEVWKGRVAVAQELAALGPQMPAAPSGGERSALPETARS